MTIDWTHFTPYHAALGGLLIGLAASLLLLFKGRIAGISGIVGSLLQRPAPGDRAWRLAFIGGLQSAEIRQVGMDLTQRITHGRIAMLDGSHLFPMEQPLVTAAAIEAALLNLSAAGAPAPR